MESYIFGFFDHESDLENTSLLNRYCVCLNFIYSKKRCLGNAHNNGIVWLGFLWALYGGAGLANFTDPISTSVGEILNGSTSQKGKKYSF